MSSLGKGTVPESGMGFGGSLSVGEIWMIKENPKGRVNITLDDGAYQIDLILTPAQILSLNRMIGEFLTTGISQAKEGAEAEGRHEFRVGLDLSLGEISVEVLPAEEGDTAFAYLELKDRQGSKAVLDLSLGLAQEIRKKLDAYFAAEREKQTARLA